MPPSSFFYLSKTVTAQHSRPVDVVKEKLKIFDKIFLFELLTQKKNKIMRKRKPNIVRKKM